MVASVQLNLLAQYYKDGNDKVKEAMTKKLAQDVLALEPGIDAQTAKNFTEAFDSAMGIAKQQSPAAAGSSSAAVGAVINVAPDGNVVVMAGQGAAAAAAHNVPFVPSTAAPPPGTRAATAPKPITMNVSEGTIIEFEKKMGTKCLKGSIAKVGKEENPTDNAFALFVETKSGSGIFDSKLPGVYPLNRYRGHWKLYTA